MVYGACGKARYLIGVVFASTAAFIVHSKVDPLPTLPPTPLFALPSRTLLVMAAAVIVLAWLGAWRVQRRADQEHLSNVRTILSQPDDPQLPANSIDAVLLLKTYHEVEKPVALLRNLRPALRPGARVGVIDRNGNGENHGVDSKFVIREAAEAGYSLAGRYDFVKDGMDYFLVFTAQQ